MMGSRDLGKLGASLNRFCKEPRNMAKKCLGTEEEESASCIKILSQASKCEEALQRAYQHINMGGCPKDIQAVTICEAEWCDNARGDRQAEEMCQKECLAVREILDKCVKGHVSSFFQRYGLEDNGTVKLQ